MPMVGPLKEQTHYPGTHAPQADLGWKLRDISCFSILVPLVTFSMRMTRSHQHAWIECNVSLLRDHELTPAPGSHHRFWFFTRPQKWLCDLRDDPVYTTGLDSYVIRASLDAIFSHRASGTKLFLSRNWGKCFQDRILKSPRVKSSQDGPMALKITEQTRSVR